MDDNDGLPLVKHAEKSVEFGRTQILSATVCGQFDAVGMQYIKRILRFFNRLVYVGQRQSSAKQEPVWVFFLQFRRRFVGHSYDLCALKSVSKVGMWRCKRQNRGLNAGRVHPFQLLVAVPSGQREALIGQHVVALERRKILRGDEMAMHIHHALG